MFFHATDMRPLALCARQASDQYLMLVHLNFLQTNIRDHIFSLSNRFDDILTMKPLSGNRCGNSDCSNEATMRCNQCKNIKYCSRECQKGDW